MKEYVKPDLFYESFELSQHIAVCAYDFKNASNKNDCSATGDLENFFIPDSIAIFNNDKCNTNPESIENFCYTTGAEGYNTFNS